MCSSIFGCWRVTKPLKSNHRDSAPPSGETGVTAMLLLQSRLAEPVQAQIEKLLILIWISMLSLCYDFRLLFKVPELYSLFSRFTSGTLNLKNSFSLYYSSRTPLWFLNSSTLNLSSSLSGCPLADKSLRTLMAAHTAELKYVCSIFLVPFPFPFFPCHRWNRWCTSL